MAGRKQKNKSKKKRKQLRSKTRGRPYPKTNQQAAEVAKALEFAVSHHKAGQLGQAEQIYRRILAVDPDNVVANHYLGVVAHQVGRYEIAIQLISRVVSLKPEYAEAHNNLGVSLKELGRLDEAAACYQKAVSLNPDYAEAHNNLGNALKEQGMSSETAVCYRKALAIKPDYVEAHNNLGVLLQEQDKPVEACICFQKALAIKPDYAEAHYNLGISFKQLGRLDEARVSFQETLAVNPQHLKAQNNLGVLFQESGRFDEACACFQKVIAARPDHAEAHYNLGNTLRDLGRLDAASASYHQAIAANPDFAEAHNNLGALWQEQGQLDEAVACYQKAIAVRSDYAEAYRNLVTIRKNTASDHQVLLMADLIQRPETSDGDKTILAFGLGKAYEDSGKYDTAFDYLQQGNKLLRLTYDYSPADDQKLFATIKKTIDASFAARYKKSGDRDDSPIFILGMPRSGTSLVEQILASHPMVHGAGELKILREVICRLSGTGFFGAVLENIHDRGAGSLLAELGPEYIKKLRTHSTTAQFITDKMPYNFLTVGLIRLALPRAKIIHCVREPMDNCLSIFKNNFVGDHKYAYDLRELGRYYREYQGLMRHWHDVFPGAVYDISYEELVTDQERQTRELLQHCDLPWNDACLEFYKTSRRVATASSAQVRRPIYQDSVKLWKQYEDHLQPLKEALFE